MTPHLSHKHPADWPIGPNMIVRPSAIYNDQFVEASNRSLTETELLQFEKEGYLVKRRLIDDDALFATTCDYVWRNAPRQLVEQGGLERWDTALNSWSEEDVANVGRLSPQGNWKMRSRGPSGIGTEAFLREGIACHRRMRAMAEAILGRKVRPPNRVRGIYSVFPQDRLERPSQQPHQDKAAAQLSAMVLASHIPPHCGGFTIWPRSHHRLSKYWSSRYGSHMPIALGYNYMAERIRVLEEVQPIEITGGPGDVVFFHPRALHSAGINMSGRDGRPLVRVVVPVDYQAADISTYDDHIYGPSDNIQWWIDTRNFYEDPATIMYTLEIGKRHES